MMNNCQHIQSLIDNADQFELTQSVTIKKHIANCPQCRLVAEAKIADSFMAQLNAVQPPPLSVTPEVIKQKSRTMHKQLVIAIAGLVTSLFALLWFISLQTLDSTGAAVLLAWVFASGGYSGFLYKKSNRIDNALLKLDVSLFDYIRQDIQFNIRVIKILGSLLLLQAIVLAGLTVFKQLTVANGLPIFLVFSASFTAFVLYQFAVVLPRLKNELALLNGPN